MPIQCLSEQLASQIAAGEVVERPASAVKELVENAIDAGATTINVEVRDGGRQLIQVADDGAGIAAGDIETAFLRHATSKLQTAEDLNAISTLGFRGEALAAVAAISRVTVVSRAQGESAGTRLMLAAGQKVSCETVGAPQGTVIAAENLFYNVPARLKFLKSVNTEKRLIDEFVTRYALAYPGIRFRLSHNGRITFQTGGSGNALDVLVAVYGPDTARQLLEIDDMRSEIEGIAPTSNLQSPMAHRPISISGFVGPPSLHWANRGHINLFVNGRWIRDNSLTYAVIQAYHTLLPTGRYPLAVIFITMPPADVDVNVHPTKTEVRFRRRTPFSAVQRAVRQTLITETPVRTLTVWPTADDAYVSPGWAGALDDNAFAHLEAAGEHAQPDLDLDWSTGTAPTAPISDDTQAPAAEVSGKRMPIMRVVGQVGASYIITEGPDGVFLIDQHAAHERILYEQFMAAWRRKAVMSQRLVAGAAVHLPPSQATLLEEHLQMLAPLGFEIEPFGPNAFMVRTVPAIVAQLDPAQALVAVVEDLERGDEPMQDEIEAQIIRRVCKTAAVKAGQTLAPSEMEAMIRQLEMCANPHTCPHGRPTLIYLSVAQLARQFGRI